MGPLLIFDKSALQSFSIDEAVWLEQFFLANITPLFYVETLADLEKEVREGKTPEQAVGELADKTPVNGAFSNANYHTLIVHDLLGNPIEMNKRSIILGGEPKISPDGKVGFYYEQSKEESALNRWKERRFLDVEREAAKQWRQALSNLSFDSLIGIVRNIVPSTIHFSNIEDVKKFVDQFVDGKDKAVLDLALDVLNIPSKYRPKIIERWEKENRPSIKTFAPYAAYVFTVDLFFYLCLNSSFIAKERASNKVDLAYLYYLPFCRIFVSSDNLHARIAMLFMMNGQLFVTGQDLKKGLKEVDDIYSKLPEETKAQGVMKFAVYPPLDEDNFISRIWDKLSSSWRKDADARKAGKDLPPDEELLKHIKDFGKDLKPVEGGEYISSDQADQVVFQRFSSTRKGKWRILPKEIEDAAKNDPDRFNK